MLLLLLSALGAPAGANAADETAVASSIVAVPGPIAKALVVVEGDAGSGSGFFATWKGSTFVVTNAHVVSGNTRLRVVAADGQEISSTELFVAVGHDIFLMKVERAPATLEIGEGVDEFASVGDPVLVAGNALGDGVFGGLPGKLLGIGPERVEVDSPFVNGNSGSPIVHTKTGRAVAIATYAMVRKFDGTLAQSSPFSEVRRFGYRFDSVKEWQRVNWSAFAKEAAEVAKMQALSDVLFDAAMDLKDGQLDASYSGTGIERAATSYRERLRSADPTRALAAHADLADSMRLVGVQDIDKFRRNALYDFHIREAEGMRPFREALAQYFAKMEELLKAEGSRR